LHREGLTFRPDGENVVSPVIDYALTLAGTDPAKIALMGISLGGVFAPRAVAFEKRISALIVNDGVYDYGAANLGHLRRSKGWNTTVTTMKPSPTAAWGITHGMFAMGARFSLITLYLGCARPNNRSNFAEFCGRITWRLNFAVFAVSSNSR